MIISPCNFSKLRAPSRHHDYNKKKRSKQKRSESTALHLWLSVGAEWHSSSPLLSPAWSVNHRVSFLPFLPSAEVSYEQSRRKEEASITPLYVQSFCRLMQPEIEQKTIQSASWDSMQPRSRDSAIFRLKSADICRKKLLEKKEQRDGSCTQPESIHLGMDAGKYGRVKHNVCWEGNNFPGGRSLNRVRLKHKHKIDERSHHVMLQNHPPPTTLHTSGLELEQDKFGAIFWKQPLETNRTLSETFWAN